MTLCKSSHILLVPREGHDIHCCLANLSFAQGLCYWCVVAEPTGSVVVAYDSDVDRIHPRFREEKFDARHINSDVPRGESCSVGKVILNLSTIL